MIPYIIAIAYPDYKRPYCEVKTNTLQNITELNEIFNNIIVEFILDFSIPTNIKFESYDKFFDRYYTDDYMDQEPIKIKYFIDGKWINYNFNEKEIMELYNIKFDKLIMK